MYRPAGALRFLDCTHPSGFASARLSVHPITRKPRVLGTPGGLAVVAPPALDFLES